MISYKSYKLPALALMLATGLLAGCDDDDSHNDNGQRSYTVKILNLTANQPLSPPAIILHQAGYKAFTDGEAASAGLEVLAEGGDNSSLLSEAQSSVAHLSSVSGTGPIGPGVTETYQIQAQNASAAYLSMVTMLVNTNDAFTAANSVNLSDLWLNQTHTLRVPVWDAGTEANTEAAGTIPGPADGGEGFNATRDDRHNFVSFHQGVVSADDGLSSSVLNESHRFDNPAAVISITRTQ